MRRTDQCGARDRPAALSQQYRQGVCASTRDCGPPSRPSEAPPVDAREAWLPHQVRTNVRTVQSLRSSRATLLRPLVGERCAAESISTSRPDAQSLDEPSKQKFLQPLRDDGAAVWKVEEGEGISENTFDVES